MKKTMVIGLIFITMLSGCGKEAADRGLIAANSIDSVIPNETTSVSEPKQNVSEEFPEELPETAVWEEYPEDNMFGLNATTSYTEQDKTTIILAFAYLKDSDINDAIMYKADSIQGMATYGYFSFDSSEVFKEDDFYYVKLSFDSRIDLNTILFDKDNERCNVSIKDGLELTYCDFRKPEETRRLYQSLDPDRFVWEDVNKDVRDETPKEDTGYIQYTELAVDFDAYEPVSVKGDVSFMACDYGYLQESHNIYGEVDRDAETTLRFSLFDPNDAVEEQDHFKLYQQTDNGYTDITPSDHVINAEFSDDDHRLWIDMHSNLLGEMTEGDYRAEYGEYSVDFRLSMQTFEVW